MDVVVEWIIVAVNERMMRMMMAGLRGQWLLTVMLSLVSTARVVPEILHGTAEHGDVVWINRHVIVGSVCGGHGVALHVTDGR